MKEKDLEKILDRLNETMDKMIDDMGERENFEKFKKEHEGESFEELLDKLKETLPAKNSYFKIFVERNKDGESRRINIQGRKRSLMEGLSDIARVLILESNLTEKDIREAIEVGIESTNEED